MECIFHHVVDMPLLSMSSSLSSSTFVHHVVGMRFPWSCSIGTLDIVERSHVSDDRRCIERPIDRSWDDTNTRRKNAKDGGRRDANAATGHAGVSATGHAGVSLALNAFFRASFPLLCGRDCARDVYRTGVNVNT